jgi:predicted protein tyrosine phosphatase
MRPPLKAALISITDPSRPKAVVRDSWAAILRLSFDDVDAVTFPGQDKHLMEITAEQVAEIASFIRIESRRCTRLVVHCRHGISRSAAVAKAVAEAIGLGFPAEYDEHNRFVYLALKPVIAYALHDAELLGQGDTQLQAAPAAQLTSNVRSHKTNLPGS